jgi:predicted N-acetyltransferase YhbS
MAYTIGYGSSADAGRLQEIERVGGARFRAVGMAEIADHEPTSTEELMEFAELGRLLVARDASASIAAFLIWSPKDGAAYIEEVASDPSHAGQRLGAKLIDRLQDDVQGRCARITLATFRDVPCNAPYYARLGFVECAAAALGPDHEAAWHEQAEFLDMSRRIFMSRVVAPR